VSDQSYHRGEELVLDRRQRPRTADDLWAPNREDHDPVRAYGGGPPCFVITPFQDLIVIF